jgi:hypothetical protein
MPGCPVVELSQVGLNGTIRCQIPEIARNHGRWQCTRAERGLAKQTGFTDADLELLGKSLVNGTAGGSPSLQFPAGSHGSRIMAGSDASATRPPDGREQGSNSGFPYFSTRTVCCLAPFAAIIASSGVGLVARTCLYGLLPSECKVDVSDGGVHRRCGDHADIGDPEEGSNGRVLPGDGFELPSLSVATLTL